MSVREYPSIDPTEISVRTNYTGANADILNLKLQAIRKAINSIDGIKTLPRQVIKGSIITIEFNLEWNLEQQQMMFEIKFHKR